MALLGIDELNKIETYFDEMDISEEEKKKRQDLCEDLFYIYYYIFAVMLADFRLNNKIDIEDYSKDLETRFKNVVSESEYASIIEDESILEYATNISKELVKSTIRNAPITSDKSVEPTTLGIESTTSAKASDKSATSKAQDTSSTVNQYWGSKERAIKVAQDITNVVTNYYELQKKIEEGYTHKTWVAMLDTKTRHSHWLAWGKTVEIDKPFNIGGVKMMCPCDHTAPAREVANCRCHLEYSKEYGIEKLLKSYLNETPYIAEEKIYEYMLKENGKHSDEFLEVGYTLENVETLRKDLINSLEGAIITREEDTEWGHKFSYNTILGITEKHHFDVAWIIHVNENFPRLVTAYRKEL
mgnify:CR=1 FL=1